MPIKNHAPGKNDKPVYSISQDVAKCYLKLPEKYIYNKMAELGVHIPIVIDGVNFFREMCDGFRDNAMEKSRSLFCAGSAEKVIYLPPIVDDVRAGLCCNDLTGRAVYAYDCSSSLRACFFTHVNCYLLTRGK